MKVSELRKLPVEELGKKEKALKEELFNLRFQHATGQLNNPQQLKDIKRDIARVKTLICEQEFRAMEANKGRK